jgi:hypothetical protein
MFASPNTEDWFFTTIPNPFKQLPDKNLITPVALLTIIYFKNLKNYQKSSSILVTISLHPLRNIH